MAGLLIDKSHPTTVGGGLLVDYALNVGEHTQTSPVIELFWNERESHPQQHAIDQNFICLQKSPFWSAIALFSLPGRAETTTMTATTVGIDNHRT
jgi:hypothetical protein